MTFSIALEDMPRSEPVEEYSDSTDESSMQPFSPAIDHFYVRQHDLPRYFFRIHYVGARTLYDPHLGLIAEDRRGTMYPDLDWLRGTLANASGAGLPLASPYVSLFSNRLLALAWASANRPLQSSFMILTLDASKLRGRIILRLTETLVGWRSCPPHVELEFPYDPYFALHRVPKEAVCGLEEFALTAEGDLNPVVPHILQPPENSYGNTISEFLEREDFDPNPYRLKN